MSRPVAFNMRSYPLPATVQAWIISCAEPRRGRVQVVELGGKRRQIGGGYVNAFSLQARGRPIILVCSFSLLLIGRRRIIDQSHGSWYTFPFLRDYGLWLSSQPELFLFVNLVDVQERDVGGFRTGIFLLVLVLVGKNCLRCRFYFRGRTPVAHLR